MKMQAEAGSLRPFLTLWIGQAISLLGSQLVQFALIWWLTQSTGSAIVLTTASLVGLLPQVILGPFVGVLVDRWNRRWTMFLADSGVMAATLLLALLFWLDVAQLWHVFVILFLRAVAGSFHWPAMTASTSLMVPEEHLTRIQGLNQMLNGGLNIIAAPLGALLVSLLPLQAILMIDAATALFAIVPLLFVMVPQPQKEAGGGETAVSATVTFWEDMKAGLSYVRNWPGLLILMGLAMIINFLVHPTIALLPLLVTNHFHGGAYHLSAIEVGIGVGIIAGGATLSSWGGFHKKIITSLVGLIGISLGLLVIGFTPATLFWLAVGGMFISGFMMSFSNGPIMAIIQSVVAPEKQGRVLTLLVSFASGMAPIGLIFAGPLAEAFGVQVWFLVSGSIMLVLGSASFLVPTLIKIEEEAPMYQKTAVSS
ncbi:MAG: MFS transporter [Anaerolineales bacterium]|nr:MFS transporter [Anaerolineales bacterium]